MERKFKHKLTNKVIKIGGKTGLSCQTIIGNSNLILGDIIKGDDWQEVVEKDYEILSFSQNISNEVVKVSKTDLALTVDEFFKNGCWNIHSVKRLSDGEIFTVGDIVDYKDGIILDIIVNCDNKVLLCIKGCETRRELQHIKAFKKSLFTTEDGVGIFEDDNVHWVCDEFRYFYTENINKTYYNLINCAKKGIYKIFPTKKAAEEYILMNKPCLSLKEIKKNTTIKGLSLKKLQKLVKQKLNL